LRKNDFGGQNSCAVKPTHLAHESTNLPSFFLNHQEAFRAPGAQNIEKKEKNLRILAHKFF